MSEQPIETPVKSDSGAAEPPVEREKVYRVGDPLPKALGPGELRRAMNVSEDTFQRLQKAGHYKRFLLRRPIGTKKYSGALVTAYLNAGLDE